MNTAARAAGRIAVVNTGTSSLKLALIECGAGPLREITRVQFDWQPGEAIGPLLEMALESLGELPDAFGHRFVHGGAAFIEPVTITAEVEAALEARLSLAPLHNAAALTAIRAVRRAYPDRPSVAAFDTAFHAQRPAESMRYALPDDLVREFHFRRFGFHGFAHASLAESLAAATETAANEVVGVTLQLGAGCSACAIRNGCSVETSMGFTPLEGLVMASRSGSVDPAIVLRLMRAGYDADRIEDELTRRSGLAALAGTTDMREILAAEAEGSPDATLAVDLFCRQVVLTTGAYFTLLGGVGALVFGGGIGTHAPEIRARIARGLSAFDVVLDSSRNSTNEPGCISASGSRKVFVFPTNEEAMIARAVATHLSGSRGMSALVSRGHRA